MVLHLSIGLLGALLAWASGAEAVVPAAESSVETLQAAATPSRSVELIPVGEPQFEFPKPGVKVVRQLFEVIDSKGNAKVLPGACIGRCLGARSDEVQGCEPVTGGCSKIRCTGDQPCWSVCTKVLSDSNSSQ